MCSGYVNQYNKNIFGNILPTNEQRTCRINLIPRIQTWIHKPSELNIYFFVDKKSLILKMKHIRFLFCSSLSNTRFLSKFQKITLLFATILNKCFDIVTFFLLLLLLKNVLLNNSLTAKKFEILFFFYI